VWALLAILLGTFLGMVVTLNGAVIALEGTTDLQTMRNTLSAPIKGLGLAFGKRGVPTPKQAMPFGRRFTPYGSVAAWYFWRACELAPALEPKVRKPKASKNPRR